MRANVSGLFSWALWRARRRAAANPPIAFLNNCYLKIVTFGAKILSSTWRAHPMRILRRGLGERLPVAGKVSVKALQPRVSTVRAAPEAPSEKPIYRNEILEELSAAAREALKPAEEPNVR
jgi:sRNA-binding carbon storage regulator CsrA